MKCMKGKGKTSVLLNSTCCYKEISMDENIKNYIPQLQFSEFKYKNTWKSTPVSQLGRVITGKTPSTKTSIYWGKEYIWVTPTDITSKKYISYTERMITSKWIKHKNILPINTVLVTCIASIGKNCILKKEGFCNQQINAIIPHFNKYNSDFIYYTFDVNKHILINNSGISATRILSKTKLEEINFLFPSLQEQQKIADCLSSLDELIEAHEQKIDALKQHKKGLMQHLFPVEDETTPRWRFPEFRNAEEWEKYEIGDIFTATRGQVLAMTEVQAIKTKNFSYPVYSSQTKNNGLAGYYSDYLYENAITWTTDGANAGEVNFRKGKFYCTNVCGVLLNKYGYANKCISEIINFVSKKYVSYVGNPKLMNNVMKKIKITIPSLPEQQKIADCLTSLDERIEAQEEKIAALKEHKKGLMQKLFPSL